MKWLSIFVVLFLFIYGSFIILPTSKTLSVNWNFGSMLAMIYFFQVFSGICLVCYYSNDVFSSFDSVQYIMYDVNYGWLLRIMHFNGASFFLFFIFLHFFKGLFFSSYRLIKVWFSGLVIFIFLMAIAFMGYVLVWAQMSFWASVVITSLLTIIPIYGFKILVWVWGGYCVSGATLKFFFVLHYLLPLILFFFLLMHFFFLHSLGSTSKLGYKGGLSKITFFPFYWLKDFYNFLFFLFFFCFIFFFPFSLGDPEMFMEANPMVSPVHIVPEWYFLFAYAILRSIPNKVVGVLFLLLSIFVFFFFVFFSNYNCLFNVLNKFLVFFFFFNAVFLSWIGQCHVEPPYIFLGILVTFLYFFIFFLIFFFYILSYFLFYFVFIMILMLKF